MPFESTKNRMAFQKIHTYIHTCAHTYIHTQMPFESTKNRMAFQKPDPITKQVHKDIRHKYVCITKQVHKDINTYASPSDINTYASPSRYIKT